MLTLSSDHLDHIYLHRLVFLLLPSWMLALGSRPPPCGLSSCLGAACDFPFENMFFDLAPEEPPYVVMVTSSSIAGSGLLSCSPDCVLIFSTRIRTIYRLTTRLMNGKILIPTANYCFELATVQKSCVFYLTSATTFSMSWKLMLIGKMDAW